MGLDLSFRDEHKAQFGKCGLPRQTFVEVVLPQRPGDIPEGKIFSPDLESHFVRNTKRAEGLALTGMPKEGGGYAILYTQVIHKLTEAEAAARYRAMEEERLPLDTPNREATINAQEADFVVRLRRPIGISVVAGMEIDATGPFVTENRFVRWVTKSEFEAVVKDVKAQLGEEYEGDDCPVYGLTEWDFEFQSGDKARHCIRCDLNTLLSDDPIIRRVLEELDTRSGDSARKALLQAVADQFMQQEPTSESNPYRAAAFHDSDARGRFRTFLAYEIEAYPELGALSERLDSFRIAHQIFGPYLPGCYRGSSYAHIASFRDFLQKRGDFPSVMQFLSSGDEVSPEACHAALAELSEIRGLVETTRVAAIETLDADGNVIATYGYEGDGRYGNSSVGYGFQLESDDVDYITIEHKSPDILSLPLARRRELVDAKDFATLMEEADQLRKEHGNFKVTEVWRENGTFRCRTRGGVEIELPAETKTTVAPAQTIDRHSPDGTLVLVPQEVKSTSTPFSGFMEHEKMQRMRITTAPATSSFDYLIRLIEKKASIATRFDIPVALR